MFKHKIKSRIKNVKVDLDITNKRTPFWKPMFLILPALLVVILFIVIPFITAANDGLHYSASGSHNHKSDNQSFGFHNFEVMFDDPQFTTSLTNSLLYAIISIPIAMFLSLLIAATISNIIKKRLRGFWQTIFFLPYVTSTIAIGLTFAYLFDFDKGLINKLFGVKVPWLIDIKGHSALWSMLIYGVWRDLAFNILIFTTAMLSIENKVFKSASIDGAGPIKQFFYITLPSIKKTTGFLFTIGLIGAIKVFPLALFNNSSQDALQHNGGTLLLYLYDKIATSHNYSQAGAASIILVAIAIGFTLLIRGSTNLIGYLSIKIRRKYEKIQIEKIRIFTKNTK